VIRIALGLLLLVVSCSPQPASEANSAQAGSAVDTSGGAEAGSSTVPPDGAPVFARRIAVFMEATSASLDSLRAKYSEEDYAVVADDMMYYRAMAYDYLEQHGVDVVRVVGRIQVQFEVDGEARSFDFSREESADLLVLYEPGKVPVAIAPVDIDRAAEYFGLSSAR
jgi:hypothetical protein